MNPRYRIGDQVFSDRDIGLPVVLRVEQAIPVREQGGYQKIVGYRYVCKGLKSLKLRTFPEGNLNPYKGPRTQQASQKPSSSSTSSQQYSLQTPPLSQLTGSGPAYARVQTFPPHQDPSQDLVKTMLPTPCSSSGASDSAEVVKPPVSSTPRQATYQQKLGAFSLLDPSQTPPPQFQRGMIFQRASKMKNTGVATLGEISDFSQVAAIQEMDEVVLNQDEISMDVPTSVVVDLIQEEEGYSPLEVKAPDKQIVKLLRDYGEDDENLKYSDNEFEEWAQESISIIEHSSQPGLMISAMKDNNEQVKLVKEGDENSPTSMHLELATIDLFENNHRDEKVEMVENKEVGDLEKVSSIVREQAQMVESCPTSNLASLYVEPAIREKNKSKIISSNNQSVSPSTSLDRIQGKATSSKIAPNSSKLSDRKTMTQFKQSKPSQLPLDYDPEDPFGDKMSLNQMARCSTFKVLRDRHYLKTWSHFEDFLKSLPGGKLEDLLSGSLLDCEVDELMAQFLAKRQNMNELKNGRPGVRLDTSTYQTLVCRLTAMMAIKTKYRPSNNSTYHLYLGVKKFYMNQSKLEGRGRLAKQAATLTVAETNYMFQDSYLTVWTPEGLQTLVFFHLVTSFNIRVGREMRAVTLGDLVHVGEPDGTVVYTVYCPGATKKDDGTRDPTKASNCFKRPVNVARNDLRGVDVKYDLSYVLQHLRSQLFKMPWTGDRNKMPLFWKRKRAHYKPGECFFLPELLGKENFNEIVRDLITRTGLDVGLRKHNISNQSLRTSTVVIQTTAGLTSDQQQQINGHINRRTVDIYNRGNCVAMAEFGRKIQSVATGLPEASAPDFSYCVLRDGTKVYPRRVLTTDQGTGLVMVEELEHVNKEAYQVLPTSPSIEDLAHSSALEGGRYEINMNTVEAQEQDSDDDANGEQLETKEGLQDTQQTDPAATDREEEVEEDEEPLVRQGSSRSGKRRRKMTMPGEMTVGKRIKQKLTQEEGSDDDEEEVYAPPASSSGVGPSYRVLRDSKK